MALSVSLPWQWQRRCVQSSVTVDASALTSATAATASVPAAAQVPRTQTASYVKLHLSSFFLFNFPSRCILFSLIYLTHKPGTPRCHSMFCETSPQNVPFICQLINCLSFYWAVKHRSWSTLQIGDSVFQLVSLLSSPSCHANLCTIHGVADSSNIVAVIHRKAYSIQLLLFQPVSWQKHLRGLWENISPFTSWL